MSTKIAPLSGFPEWLPPQRMIEQQIIARVQHTFELYGFSPLETRAVEPLDQLLRKGETSKEVYVLSRLQADAADTSDASLGLHFDLTVPFARFVLENAGKLQFPFRRYQIQKVWRGERPQQGRYREFTQADIDIVGRDTLGVRQRRRDPAGHRRRAERPADPAGDDPDQQSQADGGLLPRRRHRRYRRGDAGRRQARQDRSGRRRRAAGLDGGRDRRAGEGVPGAGRDLVAGRVVRRRRPRARRHGSAARRGSRRAGPGRSTRRRNTRPGSRSAPS